MKKLVYIALALCCTACGIFGTEPKPDPGKNDPTDKPTTPTDTFATAYNQEVDGIFYNLKANGTAVVTFAGSRYSEVADEYRDSVIIPASVSYSGAQYSVVAIGRDACRDCRNLSAISIPATVETVESNSSFKGCDNLTDVTIHSPMLMARTYSFMNGLVGLFGNQVSHYTLGEGITRIGDHAFSDCSGMTTISLPEGLTEIGDNAFNRCSGLTSLSFPASLSSLGIAVISNCCELTSVTVDPANRVFDSREGCNALIRTADNTLVFGCRNTIIPSGITTIGASAFIGCLTLAAITIPESVTTLEKYAFCRTGLKSIVIPDAVTQIRMDCFCECDSLTSVEIGNRVDSIGRSAFLACRILRSVRIPDAVTAIGRCAFQCCWHLDSVWIGNGVTSIGEYAFNDTPELRYLHMGSGLTDIGSEAFNYHSANPANYYISEIHITAPVPPACDSTVFQQPYLDAKLYVPAASIDSFRAAPVWSSFRNIIAE